MRITKLLILVVAVLAVIHGCSSAKVARGPASEDKIPDNLSEWMVIKSDVRLFSQTGDGFPNDVTLFVFGNESFTLEYPYGSGYLHCANGPCKDWSPSSLPNDSLTLPALHYAIVKVPVLDNVRCRLLERDGHFGDREVDNYGPVIKDGFYYFVQKPFYEAACYYAGPERTYSLPYEVYIPRAKMDPPAKGDVVALIKAVESAKEMLPNSELGISGDALKQYADSSKKIVLDLKKGGAQSIGTFGNGKSMLIEVLANSAGVKDGWHRWHVGDKQKKTDKWKKKFGELIVPGENPYSVVCRDSSKKIVFTEAKNPGFMVPTGEVECLVNRAAKFKDGKHESGRAELRVQVIDKDIVLKNLHASVTDVEGWVEKYSRKYDDSNRAKIEQHLAQLKADNNKWVNLYDKLRDDPVASRPDFGSGFVIPVRDIDRAILIKLGAATGGYSPAAHVQVASDVSGWVGIDGREYANDYVSDRFQSIFEADLEEKFLDVAADGIWREWELSRVCTKDYGNFVDELKQLKTAGPVKLADFKALLVKFPHGYGQCKAEESPQTSLKAIRDGLQFCIEKNPDNKGAAEYKATELKSYYRVLHAKEQLTKSVPWAGPDRKVVFQGDPSVFPKKLCGNFASIDAFINRDIEGSRLISGLKEGKTRFDLLALPPEGLWSQVTSKDQVLKACADGKSRCLEYGNCRIEADPDGDWIWIYGVGWRDLFKVNNVTGAAPVVSHLVANVLDGDCWR